MVGLALALVSQLPTCRFAADVEILTQLSVIAQTLASNGAKVYITGRRLDVLQQSASIHGTPEALGNSGGSLHALQMDISVKESIQNATTQIKANDEYVNM